MVSRIVLVCMAGVAALVAAGCGGSADAGDSGSLVAAFHPLAYAVRQVAPAGSEVVDLTPPGAEPHDLELSARDVERLRDAALVVYAGGGFQPAVEDAVRSRDGRRSTSSGSVELLDGDRRSPTRTSGSTRCATRRSPARSRLPSGARRRRTHSSNGSRRSTGTSPRARALRASRDRDEPCGVRLPRRPVRPRAGPSRRRLARGRARRAGYRAARRRGAARRGPRRSSSSRSSRHGSPRRSRARQTSRRPSSTRSRG